jgi:DNA repair photolyase
MKSKSGRGASYNPPNRFERLHLEPLAGEEEDRPPVPTEFFIDSSRSILSKNDSPDVPFTYSINPYRGCEHGCIYCYARASHEFLGFSAGIDFESRILVKPDAPRLLEQAFRRKGWQPQPVALSGNTDCYQPVERRLKLTRACLEVFLKYHNPVSIITKSGMVTRDLDLLTRLAGLNLVEVTFSITTLDPDLARIMEPRASIPALRLDALESLSKAGIPVGVNAAPVIPGLTDEELPAILREAAAKGARYAGYMLVRLPFAVENLFVEWLKRNLPRRAAKVLNRLREVRGGKLNESEFGKRACGEGKMAESIRSMFEMFSRKYGLDKPSQPLSTHHFRTTGRGQLSMF